MDPLAVGIISGLVGSLAGGIIGAAAVVLFTRWSDRSRDLARRRFRIYMALLDWQAEHFWVTSHEIQNKEIPLDLRHRLDIARYKISDELRGADDLGEMSQIVKVLFSRGYAKEVDRANAIRALTDRLAMKVNPRFVTAAKAIEAESMAMIQRDMETGADEWMQRRRKIEPWW